MHAYVCKQKTIIARKLTRTQFNSARSFIICIVSGVLLMWGKQNNFTKHYTVYYMPNIILYIYIYTHSGCPYEWWNPESIIHNIMWLGYLSVLMYAAYNISPSMWMCIKHACVCASVSEDWFHQLPIYVKVSSNN